MFQSFICSYAMASPSHLIIRNTFVEIFIEQGGDARPRKSRSEGPPRSKAVAFSLEALGGVPCPPVLNVDAASWTQCSEAGNTGSVDATNHVIPACGFFESRESGGVEQDAFSTPWSSLCGDWGYQGDATPDPASDLPLEANLTQTLSRIAISALVSTTDPGDVLTRAGSHTKAEDHEPSSGTIPWSSVGDDWDHHNSFSTGTSLEVLLRIPAGLEPGASTCFDVHVVEEHATPAQANAIPTEVKNCTIATDAIGEANAIAKMQAVSPSNMQAGSYLTALLEGIDVPCPPCGRDRSPDNCLPTHAMPSGRDASSNNKQQDHGKSPKANDRGIFEEYTICKKSGYQLRLAATLAS